MEDWNKIVNELRAGISKAYHDGKVPTAMMKRYNNFDASWFEKVKANKDELSNYAKALQQFVKSNKIKINKTPIPVIPPAKQAEPTAAVNYNPLNQPILTQGELQRAVELNNVINYLEQIKGISSKDVSNLRSLQRTYYPNNKITLKGFNIICQYWQQHQLPDIEAMSQRMNKFVSNEIPKQTHPLDQSTPTSGAINGLDVSKMTPKGKQLITTYVDYLQKLTGKSVSFQ